MVILGTKGNSHSASWTTVLSKGVSLVGGVTTMEVLRVLPLSVQD
jgi:hypothetical protein